MSSTAAGAAPGAQCTLGEAVVRRLALHGVQHVFGIPGVHNVEIYRGFAACPQIRHVTPRHEQGAGFMADGYARTSGRPGVCFVISGPGLTNIATAMGQARADSIPMLVISTCQPPGRLGTGNGYLHELLDQQGLGRHLAVRSTTARSPGQVAGLIEEAFAIFASARPGPVHIDIPTVFLSELVDAHCATPTPVRPPQPAPEAIAQAAQLLARSQRPLILAGGGAIRARSELAGLARRLHAPVCLTNNARGLLPPDDPLCVSHSASLAAVRGLINAADCVVAVGTELGQTDYDMYDDGGFRIDPPLIRIDIDAAQVQRNAAPAVAIVADAAAALWALESACPARPQGGLADSLAGGLAGVRAQADAQLSPTYRLLCRLLADVQAAVPGICLIGDSTQISYAGSLAHAAAAPSSWITSSTGYGTLGYALPASIGAHLGARARGEERAVMAIVGDGGLQFTLGELGSARDAGAPVLVLLWNNRGYGEIRTYMQGRGIVPEGVDILAPEFSLLAQAYGWNWVRAVDGPGVVQAVTEAAAARTATIIEVDEETFLRQAGKPGR